MLGVGVKESPLVSSVSCSVFRDPELRLWTVTLGMLCVVENLSLFVLLNVVGVPGIFFFATC